jgi:3-oxoacyl-[acyl-carrier protein] reductase
MKRLSVSGKTILITGASRGIGRALAQGFHDEGAIVYGTGRSADSIAWMGGTGIEGRAADVMQSGAIAGIIDEIIQKHGRLDVLLNNAGIASNTPAGGMKEEEMDRIIDTNFKGLYRACQAYYKAQRKAGGVIINNASILGIIGAPLAAVYCGTKGAVLQVTRALAIEWASNNFRVNAIAPGFIDTDMTEMIKKRPQVLEKMQQAIPLGRLGQPEDLVGAALFLASDAAAYVTGQVIVVDGGVIAQ